MWLWFIQLLIWRLKDCAITGSLCLERASAELPISLLIFCNCALLSMSEFEHSSFHFGDTVMHKLLQQPTCFHVLFLFFGSYVLLFELRRDLEDCCHKFRIFYLYWFASSMNVTIQKRKKMYYFCILSLIWCFRFRTNDVMALTIWYPKNFVE